MTPRSENPVISMEGAGAVLLDAADAMFSPPTQERVWAVAKALRQVPGVMETVPGMNNLMVVFDPVAIAPEKLERKLDAAWHNITPDAVAGREVEVPVRYGGAEGEDLAALAEYFKLTPAEVVRRHSEGHYSVAAVGAMPGFVYLSGLDSSLAVPRRAVPRMKVEVGSVIIGGSQAGIMPVTAPSGWHIIGRTDITLFDASREPPAAFRPGDRIRFRVERILP